MGGHQPPRPHAWRSATATAEAAATQAAVVYHDSHCPACRAGIWIRCRYGAAKYCLYYSAAVGYIMRFLHSNAEMTSLLTVILVRFMRSIGLSSSS